MQRALLILALAALCSPALAQRSRAQPSSAPAASPAPAQPLTAAPAAPQAGGQAPATPAAPEPQRTTATFGDWTLRCVRPEHGPSMCEVDQVLSDKGQPIAQTAIGRPRAGEPLRLTVLVPVSVSFTTQPRLVGPDAETGVSPIFLTWRRCVPQGCLADVSLTDEQVKRLRTRTENARVLFQDAGGREAALPFGPRGLSQALDALAKEP